MQDKAKIIEAILFWKGEPVSKKKLRELGSLEADELEKVLYQIEESLKDRGVTLIKKDDEVMLGTDPEASKIIEEISREELSKELSKATLETLSTVLFLAPVRRSQIDYVRGVNSQFSLRHLEIRGLVEKVPDDKDSRVHLYRPTFDCLSFLGVSSIEELPGFIDTRARLQDLEQSKADGE